MRCFASLEPYSTPPPPPRRTYPYPPPRRTYPRVSKSGRDFLDNFQSSCSRIPDRDFWNIQSGFLIQTEIQYKWSRIFGNFPDRDFKKIPPEGYTLGESIPDRDFFKDSRQGFFETIPDRDFSKIPDRDFLNIFQSLFQTGIFQRFQTRIFQRFQTGIFWKFFKVDSRQGF